MEASSAARDNGECVSDVPGSESMAGHSKIHSGTWDSHIVPDSEASNEPKRQRRKYDDVAVGPVHSKGVGGVNLTIASVPNPRHHADLPR